MGSVRAAVVLASTVIIYIYIIYIIFKTVDESHSAHVLILIGCKPIIS